MRDCPKCLGEGKVANSDDQEPWSMWTNLPLKSAAAVLVGLVKPIDCPRCNGTGKLGLHCDTCRCETTL